MRRWSAAIALSLLPVIAAGQSLGELARKEKERRKKNEQQGIKARVIHVQEVSTEEGTRKEPPDPAAAGNDAPTAQAEKKDTNAKKDTDAKKSAGEPDRRLDEAAWRNRAAQARSRVEKARQRYEALKQLSLVQGEYYVDENNRPVITSLEQLRSMVSEAQADLTAAEEALDDLLDEARRSGVPPGWLR